MLAEIQRRLIFIICLVMLVPTTALVAEELDPQVATSVIEGFTPIETVNRPATWNRFRIFVWQFHTDATKDHKLYEQVGLNAFHLDRGEGKQSITRWSNEHKWPYYVDHAAGKGVLHLTNATGLSNLKTDGSLQPRPQSLITAKSIDSLCRTLDVNLAVANQGQIAAVALDDEISLASFNNPVEVDASAESINLFQTWLESKYGSISKLNRQWNSDWKHFSEIQPTSFETIRPSLETTAFADWNLSPWIDWRTYMDDQFSSAIARLVRHGSERSAGVPVGIVGGQQPSPFGGYDYSKITNAVQWIESYDIGGTNELLTSFWSESRKPIVQTFFATGDIATDQWMLWYYLAHGNAGAIAWPDIKGRPWFGAGSIHPAVKALQSTFREVQAPKLAFLTDPKTRRIHDRVAMVYSHESVQASWAADALVHGKTWPRRSSSLDNACSSAGKNRVAWNKLLEDLGIQAQWIRVDDLENGMLDRSDFDVVVLPRTMAISDAACNRIQAFVDGGGFAIADYWTAILDSHGKARVDPKGRLHGKLDHLFGIQRDESRGYFDGHTVSEINGEKYNQPFLERLPADAEKQAGGMIVERGTSANINSPHADLDNPTKPPITFYAKQRGRGRTLYMNLSLLAYFDNTYRISSEGDQLRKAMANAIGNRLRIKATLQSSESAAMAEILHWRRGDEDYLVIIGNPSRQASVNDAGSTKLVFRPQRVTLKPHFSYTRAIDIRSGNEYDPGQPILFDWHPESATVLRFTGMQSR
ncbi:alpha-amylase family protein [Novipirellula caenicola]|uniref:Beta-galactosidase n=1 Tax=Novipirellula caenicola TaxID=1536901 RepID=A0ABP9VW08_9BACT